MISLNNVTKQYGDKILYKNGSLQINPGEKIGLVGPNGAGKTTIFNVIMGREGVDTGQISVADRLVVGYFSQNVGDMAGRSALEEVKLGAGKITDLARDIAEMEKRLSESATTPMSDTEMEKLLEKYGDAQAEFERRGGYDLDSRAQAILTGLGIGPSDFHRPTESFSGGWKMRIELAKILTLNPDVLLMDEPTNHLDLESILWLEEFLFNFKGALLMTSHDRDFMNRLVKKIIEVSNKTITTYSGNFDYYEKEKVLRLEQLKASYQRQQDMLAKENEFIARFAARASHAAQVQSRVKKIEKIERIEIPAEDAAIRFQFPIPPRSGEEVLKFQALGKVWKQEGQDKLVFEGATALVKRMDRVAVVGVNGAGKSTLLKIMADQTEPTSGSMVLGANVKVGYFSQHALDVLNSKNTAYDEVYNRVPNANQGYVRSLLGAFLFIGDEVHKKISVLSGGEKSRLVLATILATPINLLILDEPTNHLDIKSRDILLEALKGFEGTIVIVSHDRHFLKALSTRVFELDRQELRPFDGDYEYYVWKKQQLLLQN